MTTDIAPIMEGLLHDKHRVTLIFKIILKVSVIILILQMKILSQGDLATYLWSPDIQYENWNFSLHWNDSKTPSLSSKENWNFSLHLIPKRLLLSPILT